MNYNLSTIVVSEVYEIDGWAENGSVRATEVDQIYFPAIGSPELSLEGYIVPPECAAWREMEFGYHAKAMFKKKDIDRVTVTVAGDEYPLYAFYRSDLTSLDRTAFMPSPPIITIPVWVPNLLYPQSYPVLCWGIGSVSKLADDHEVRLSGRVVSGASLSIAEFKDYAGTRRTAALAKDGRWMHVHREQKVDAQFGNVRKGVKG